MQQLGPPISSIQLQMEGQLYAILAVHFILTEDILAFLIRYFLSLPIIRECAIDETKFIEAFSSVTSNNHSWLVTKVPSAPCYITLVFQFIVNSQHYTNSANWTCFQYLHKKKKAPANTLISLIMLIDFTKKLLLHKIHYRKAYVSV